MSDTVISNPTSVPSRPAVRQARAWGATSAKSPVASMSIERREPLADDVVIEILYCGVCHSDLHQVRNEWQNSIYPIVPGHEIVGRVTKVGSAVTKFREGDLAAVGCMVDSCRTARRARPASSSTARTATSRPTTCPTRILGGPTFGGYSESIVVEGVVHAEGAGRASTSPRRRRCCARASPPTRRCATGRWAPARRSASSASAGSGTWG